MHVYCMLNMLKSCGRVINYLTHVEYWLVCFIHLKLAIASAMPASNEWKWMENVLLKAFLAPKGF